MSDRKKYRARAIERKLDELRKELADHPPTWDKIQEYRKHVRIKSNALAVEQIWRATPPSNHELQGSAWKYATVAQYQTFLPSDGIESTLSRLAIAVTSHAMDCFARAGTLDSPARLLELNVAAKLCKVAVGLSKALDSHRGRDWPIYIDDIVANPPKRAAGTSAASESESAKSPSGQEGTAAPDESK